MTLPPRFRALPGADLIEHGLRDLASGRRTAEAMLVLVGAPRLALAGLVVGPGPPGRPEHALYGLLHAADPDAAHGRYNALLRRLVSFERAAACAG